MLKSYQVTVCFVSLLLMACESDVERSQREAIERLETEVARRGAVMDDSLAVYQRRDSIAQVKPALAVNPCDRPRPYKNWSNEELNIAQVEYMGTPQSMELIREAGCRTR